MSFAWVLAVALLLVLLATVLGVAGWAYQTAHRLDRLHVRCDLSWQVLDSALARRAVVARAIAADVDGDAAVGVPPASGGGKRLRALADVAERASRPARETAENELSAGLAMLDIAALRPALIAELADAEARVLLARRFHNDAVRDTLALRDRRAVRWLRLGGTAPPPSYFEIVERAQSVPGEDARVGGPRTSARVVLLDEAGRVLLLSGTDPAAGADDPPRWWFTVGGEAQLGETLAQTAAREVGEETGLSVEPAEMIGPVWRRDAILEFNNSVVRSHELFFVHRTHRFEPSPAGQTALERSYIHGHRWCDAGDILRLAASGEIVYPLQLGELLVEANRLADGPSGAVADPQPIR